MGKIIVEVEKSLYSLYSNIFLLLFYNFVRLLLASLGEYFVR